MTTVALLGTLDTKGAEYAWLRERLADFSVETLVIDVGSFSDGELADITADEVIAAADGDEAALRERREASPRSRLMTGPALSHMAAISPCSTGDPAAS